MHGLVRFIRRITCKKNMKHAEAYREILEKIMQSYKKRGSSTVNEAHALQKLQTRIQHIIINFIDFLNTVSRKLSDAISMQ